MMRLVLFFSVLLFYSGCIQTDVSFETQEVKVSKKIYKDISKDAILEATKKIFLIANNNYGNKEFVIDSYRNKVEVSRVLFESNIFLVDLFLDKWIIEVYQLENETRVNLSLVRTDATNQIKNIKVDDNIYELFWSRLDFILGLNDEWIECSTYLYTINKAIDTTLCNNFSVSDKPKEDDKIKDIYISQRERKNYTIDKIKTNIFENPSLDDTKVNEGLYTDSEKVEDIKIKNVVLEEQIFETKEEKVEVAAESQTEEVAETKEKIDSKNSGDEKIKEEDINAFTKNINNIINKKKE